jgi:hypothetical protein
MRKSIEIRSVNNYVAHFTITIIGRYIQIKFYTIGFTDLGGQARVESLGVLV